MDGAVSWETILFKRNNIIKNRRGSKMNRSAAREETFKVLYSLEMQKKEETEEQIKLYIENNGIKNKETIQYMHSTIAGIEKNLEEINAKISENLKSDWKINRISKVDLVLLRLAIYEILLTDTPYKVAINEVVELSKKYSEETSSNFINGVLASIVKENGESK